MNVKYKLNLDVYKDRNYESIIVAQNDDKSRIIECKLYADSQPVALSSSVTAAFNATVDNVIVAENIPCTITDNTINVALEKSMLQLAGMMQCELVLTENDTILTTQHFSVYVNKSVINSKSKYEPNGGTLATKDDINTAIKKVKDEVLTKADKADTLAGYGITDAYDKTYINRALKLKLDAKPFDTTPKENSPNYITSGTLYNSVNALNQSIAKKYDSSNIESGSGSLTPGQATFDGNEGGFNYVKNGKVVTVSVNITKLVANKSYIQMAGLPFSAKSESKFSSIAVYSTTNKLRNIRLDGSWLYISSPSDKFTDDEKLNFTITYIRQ
ncbi:hypothetical protein [Ruminococcus sp.]